MALTKQAREFFAKEGRKGGKATAERMTPEERIEKMRKAAQARWAKDKKVIEKSIRTINQNLDHIERAAKSPKAKKRKA